MTFPAPRRSLRVPLPVQTVKVGEGPERRFLGYVGNVSETGIFVQCTNPRPIGTRVEISLALPGVKDPVRCRVAEIVWIRSYESGCKKSPGMGVQFVDLPDDSRAALRRFCRKSETEPSHIRAGG